MAHAFTTTRLVEFADTDAAGIMHFANFFRYMEQAEHAFLRSLGHSVHEHAGGVLIGWPRVHAECDYKRPLRFEDRVEVRLSVREKRARSIAYDFVFRKVVRADTLAAEAETEEVARGSMVVVCAAKRNAEDAWAATPIPADLAEKIEAAPAETPP